MYRDVGMQDSKGRMFHDYKHIEKAEGCRDHHTEITGDNHLRMVADKRAPALRREVLTSILVQTRGPSLRSSSLANRPLPHDGLS
jgi:hypothetical protein